MKRLIAAAAVASAVLVASAAGAAPLTPAGQAASPTSRNPLGIVVVHFKPGTSAQAMENAIANAGGVVTSDLSKIGWMAATSKNSNFMSKLGADATVTALASDKIYRSINPDATGGAGETGNNDPALGNGPVGPPDPWHNLPSYLGETNPEGILQWDDNRMDVPNPDARSHAWPDATKNVVRDQLTYYSNYGSRVDIAAPGGARKFNIPRYDIGDADILYGGWGTLGALDGSGELCTDPSFASILTFACFKVQGAGFGWLQGTSMSSPNAVGVAALALAAHPNLKGNPNGLLAGLQTSARTSMVNIMGRNDPSDTSNSAAGVGCPTGFCHVDRSKAIPFSDAYGAGMVDAAAAVG